jgi:ribosomal protein S18 acetylase RimI-like enzyme
VTRDWVIRSGTATDVEAVLALWRVAGAEPSLTDDAASLQALIAHDDGALVVAAGAGAIVGSVVVGFDGRRANLYRLAVDPAWRRRGLALELVAEAERRLAARGCRRASALVLANHPDAVGFWEAAGFAKDPRVGRHVKNLGAADR